MKGGHAGRATTSIKYKGRFEPYGEKSSIVIENLPYPSAKNMLCF
jgi:hypothetical protein